MTACEDPKVMMKTLKKKIECLQQIKNKYIAIKRVLETNDRMFLE